MREQWARYIAFLTGLVVVLLAVMFAIIQNPPQPTTAEDADAGEKVLSVPQPDLEEEKLITSGSRVYVAQGCAMCHSVAGVGNLRNPLDGVGSRRSAESIRQWIVGAEEIKDQLPASIFRVKQNYGNIEKKDLDTLVVYLQSI